LARKGGINSQKNEKEKAAGRPGRRLETAPSDADV